MFAALERRVGNTLPAGGVNRGVTRPARTLSAAELPIGRRAVASAALVPALGAWNHAGVGFELVLAVLAAPMLLMHVNRTFAQLAVRVALFATLLVGCGGGAKAFGAPAAGIALVALGTSGLGDKVGETFRPRAHRGLLQALVIVAGIEFLLLSLRLPHALRDFSPWIFEHPRRAAFELVWPIAAAAALWGLYRMRVWGVLSLVGTSTGLFVLAGLGFRRVAGIVWLPLSQRIWLPLTALSIVLVAALVMRLAKGR